MFKMFFVDGCIFWGLRFKNIKFESDLMFLNDKWWLFYIRFVLSVSIRKLIVKSLFMLVVKIVD